MVVGRSIARDSVVADAYNVDATAGADRQTRIGRCRRDPVPLRVCRHFDARMNLMTSCSPSVAGRRASPRWRHCDGRSSVRGRRRGRAAGSRSPPSSSSRPRRSRPSQRASSTRPTSCSARPPTLSQRPAARADGGLDQAVRDPAAGVRRRAAQAVRQGRRARSKHAASTTARTTTPSTRPPARTCWPTTRRRSATSRGSTTLVKQTVAQGRAVRQGRAVAQGPAALLRPRLDRAGRTRCGRTSSSSPPAGSGCSRSTRRTCSRTCRKPSARSARRSRRC